MAKRAFHDDYRREHEVKRGSERSFGFVFTAAFTVVGLLPLLHGGAPRVWALVTAGLFAVAGIAAPKILAPLNRAWFHFGLLLNRVTSPLIMAVLFYAAITPFGLVMRAFRADPLMKRLDPNARSYWVERKPPGPAPETMANQF